ncbi:MAG TPA: DUF1656 domain-containing protein [Gemmatimonadales bacterium]|nr:DUF1656 domain-containing protein [Gemmatimonadales bacterium]
MTGDISLFGVFVPALLVAALGAAVAQFVLRRVLARVGFYRHVWHRTLVDVALYIILLGLLVLLLPRVAAGAGLSAVRVAFTGRSAAASDT